MLLEKRLARFSTERLNHAMERAWKRKHDPEKFFAVSIFDGDGAVIKVGSSFFTILHFERWVGSGVLGEQELPEWGIHSAYSSIECKCPGGVPEGETRHTIYGFLGLLCAELVTFDTVGIMFAEERIVLQNTPALCKRLRSGDPINPIAIARELQGCGSEA